MNNISSLLKRFFESQKSNTTPYFEANELVSLIDYFLDKDDAPNLKTVIELGNELYPGNIGFRISLCKTLVALEDFKQALKLAYDIGIKGNKDIDLIRLECYCELDRHDEMIELIDELTALDSPYLEDAVFHTACVMNDMEKRHQDTYHFIQHALTLFPDNLPLKSELCFNLELQGKTKEALNLCRELLDEDPYSAEIWYMQGRLYSLCADFERSVDSLDFALTCISEAEDPDLEYEIKLMKAYCLYKNENYEKAISIYEELTSNDNFENPEIEPFLAECFMNLEEYEKAYHVLKPVLGNNDLEDEVSVYGNFIYCCIETERRKEAIDVLSEALKLFSNRILEYLSTLNMTRERLTEPYAGKVSAAGELARNYLNSGVHNN
ncbi:MAG: multidrug transporter [Tannerella sp.]|jgi:tetratricopeptide (TPR) repeat protein|nr:multidrug transporter [Tannerella sp.]